MSKEKKGHRLLCFGAHPDDCEMQASGLAAFWTGAGGAARFVSMTDGSSRINDYHPDEAVARFTREILTTQPSERLVQDSGGIRPSSADAPGSYRLCDGETVVSHLQEVVDRADEAPLA